MNLPFHISYTGLIIGTSISGGWCYLGGKGGVMQTNCTSPGRDDALISPLPPSTVRAGECWMWLRVSHPWRPHSGAVASPPGRTGSGS